MLTWELLNAGLSLLVMTSNSSISPPLGLEIPHLVLMVPGLECSVFVLGDHGSFTGIAGRAGGCGDTARHGSIAVAGL